MLEDDNKIKTELEDQGGNKVVVTEDSKEETTVEPEQDQAAVITQEEDEDDTEGIVVIPPKNNKKRNGTIIGIVTGVVIVILVLVLCLTLIRCEDDSECAEGDETCLVDQDLTTDESIIPGTSEDNSTGQSGGTTESPTPEESSNEPSGTTESPTGETTGTTESSTGETSDNTESTSTEESSSENNTSEDSTTESSSESGSGNSSSDTSSENEPTEGDSSSSSSESGPVTLTNYTLSFTFKYSGVSESCPEYASLYLVGSWDSWSQFNELEEGDNNTYTYTFNSIEASTTAYEYLVVLAYTDATVDYTYKTTADNQSFTVNEADGNSYTNDIEITLTNPFSSIIPNPTIPDKTNVTVTFKITYNEQEQKALDYASLRITGTFNGWDSWYECDTDDEGNYYYTFETLSVTTYTYCAVLYYTGEENEGNPYEYKVNGEDATFEVSADVNDDHGNVQASLVATNTLSEILSEKVFNYADEDTTDYPVITVYDSLNRYTYYNGDRVVIEGASVIGRHGKVLTIQQKYSSSYYQVEVWCLSIPDDVSLGKEINVIGTVSVEFGRRVVLEDARVECVGSGSIGYASKIRYVQNDPYNYFYYSGQIVKHQFRVIYEVDENANDLTEQDQKVLTVPNLYKAYRVEYRNWYKGSSSYSTGTDRGYTYIVLYDDLTDETKEYYSYFFDGVKDGQAHTVGNTIFSSSWQGVVPTDKGEEGYEYDPSDYHFFEAYAKYQYYEQEFYFNFDEFERSYISNSNYTSYSSVMTNCKNDENGVISGILSGFFNTGDEVSITGILMEQHGNTITIQEYNGTQGSGLCLEVELNDNESKNLKTAYALLITVTGRVAVHESDTLVDYTHTLTDATIDYDAQCTETEKEEGTSFDILNHYSESKTRLYYGTSSISTVSNNIYGEYSAAYMHAGIEVTYVPDTWEDDEDFWFIGRLRYKSGSITYVLSEYIPVVIYKDEQQEELDFYKAMVNGIDEEGSSVTLNKAAYRGSSGTSKLTVGVGGPTIEAGYTGIKVGDIFMSNFMHLHYYDESVSEAFNALNEVYPFSDDRYLSIDFNSGTAMVTTPW